MTMSKKHKPALTALTWKFLPSESGDARVPSSHPPAQPPHPPGLDLEAEYSAFLEDARRMRLTNPQPWPDNLSSSPAKASMLAAQSDYSAEADLQLVPDAVSSVLRELAAGGTGQSGYTGRAKPNLSSSAQLASAPRIAELDDDGGQLHPSPAIIWKPAVPVKLATGIPPELMAKGPRDEQRLRAGSSAGVRFRAPPTRSKLVPNTWNKPRKVSANAPAVLPFGAWYLPSEAWGKPAPPHDGETAPEIAHIRDPSEIQSMADSAADAAAAGITQKLTTLYSSKMYKDYLRQHGARVPSYLQRVETPKIGMRRSVNPPQVEGVTATHAVASTLPLR